MGEFTFRIRAMDFQSLKTTIENVVLPMIRDVINRTKQAHKDCAGLRDASVSFSGPLTETGFDSLRTAFERAGVDGEQMWRNLVMVNPLCVHRTRCSALNAADRARSCECTVEAARLAQIRALQHRNHEAHVPHDWSLSAYDRRLLRSMSIEFDRERSVL